MFTFNNINLESLKTLPPYELSMDFPSTVLPTWEPVYRRKREDFDSIYGDEFYDISSFSNRDGTKCDFKNESPNINNENCICEFIKAEYFEFDNQMVSTTCRHLNNTAIEIGDICPEGTCYLNGCQDEALEYIEAHLVQPLIISCFIGMVVYSLGLISIFGLIKEVNFMLFNACIISVPLTRTNMSRHFSTRKLESIVMSYFKPSIELKQKSK